MTRFGEQESSVYADQYDIYAGNSNPDLARKICRYLGVELGRAEVFQFANENIFVKILDNVREKDVFLVQPTNANGPSVRRGRSGLACPTHVLFNGGVMKASPLRERIVGVLGSWLQ